MSANAPNGTSIDLSPLQPLAGKPVDLVAELGLRLLHDAMSTEAGWLRRALAPTSRGVITSWCGAPLADLLLVFPKIGRFDTSNLRPMV